MPTETPPVVALQSYYELLHVALAQERLAELVGQMEQEAGPASSEAYDRVLAQWFEAE